MHKIACVRVHLRAGSTPPSSARFADWTERFALFGRSSWGDEATRSIFVESHGRLSLYGGARGWAETLAGFAEGMGLEVSIAVGFTPERLVTLARPGAGVLTLASKEDERARVLALRRDEERDLHLLGPLWAHIA